MNWLAFGQMTPGYSFTSARLIGSTAASGLLAKPIVDIQLGAASFPPLPSMSVLLVRPGYESLGEAGVSGRLYFRRRSEPEVNTHVVLLQGEHWSNDLAIRNFLRGSPPAKRQYANAKLAAVRSSAIRLRAYSAAKAPVIASLLAQAQASQNAC